MKIDCAAGNEQWIQWAKRKLAALESMRLQFGLPKLQRTYEPASGVLVFVMTALGQQLIRITGAAAGRIFQRVSTDVDPDQPYAAYRIVQGKLKEYALGTAYTTEAYPAWSWNARSYVYMSSATEIRMQRDNGAEQAFAVLSGFQDGPNMYSAASGIPLPIEWAQDLAVGQASGAMLWASADGTLVASGGSRGYPDIYRWNEVSGTFSLESSGEPAAVAALKAEWPNHVFDYQTTAPDNRQYIYYGPVAHYNTGFPHPDTNYQYYSRLECSMPAQFAAAPMYDHFSDSLLLHVRATVVDHIDVVDSMPDERQRQVYLKRVDVLFRYEGAGTWLEIDRRTTGPVDYIAWSESANSPNSASASIVGSYGGLDVHDLIFGSFPYRIDGGADRGLCTVVIEKGKPARFAWIHTGQVRTGTATTTPPTGSGALASDVPPRLVVSGVVQAEEMAAMSTNDTYRPSLQCWSARAVLYVDGASALHFDRDALVTTSMPASYRPWLASNGSQLWVDNITADKFQLYAAGTLRREYAKSVPAAADTYASAPADGFWYVDSLHGWSIDRTVFKARVFTHTELISGPFGPAWIWRDAMRLIKYDAAGDKFSVVKEFAAITDVHENPGDTGSALVPIFDGDLVQDELLAHPPT